MSQAVAHIIVLRENGLQQVKKMLQEGEEEMRTVSLSLLKNLSRYKELHSDISECLTNITVTYNPIFKKTQL